MKCKIPGFQTVKGFRHRPKDGVGGWRLLSRGGPFKFFIKDKLRINLKRSDFDSY